MTARYSVGLDLGTTHSALAYARLDDGGGRSEVLRVPQLVARGSVEARSLLPSFLYFAHAGEGPLALPWDASRGFAVGELARTRAAEAPARVVSSAKSWLSYPAVDRRSPLLPPAAPPDIEKISPVEASFRYLDHLGEAWNAAHGEAAAPLAEQSIVLAVPASFDAGARELTVEAAYAAGMEDVTLLEEPQAALYAWIEAVGDDFRTLLRVGDVVLIVDVGGGTTDFSAVEVTEENGALELRRIAVGDHILLGGDNMDLALAHAVRARLEGEGKELDAWQMAALTHACRAAKERLFSTDAASLPVVVPSRGSALIGGSLRAELRREDVERILVDGFFPMTAAGDEPARRTRAGLTQVGLPYAADPAVTRHLASFLRRQAGALGGAGALLRPTAVLFNGGVLKAKAIEGKLVAALNGWLSADGAGPVRVLPAGDLDLAVARGAAYYGLVRRGNGLRIRGGTARAYYLGIESPAPAVPGVAAPVTALCVAPFGMEEGTRAELPPHELGLIVGEPVRFRFFGSSVRRTDQAGTELERWRPGDLEELSPIEVTLPAEGRSEGDLVAVRLEAEVTAVGTLEIAALPLHPRRADERWKLELNVRGGA